MDDGDEEGIPEEEYQEAAQTVLSKLLSSKPLLGPTHTHIDEIHRKFPEKNESEVDRLLDAFAKDDELPIDRRGNWIECSDRDQAERRIYQIRSEYWD